MRAIAILLLLAAVTALFLPSLMTTAARPRGHVIENPYVTRPTAILESGDSDAKGLPFRWNHRQLAIGGTLGVLGAVLFLLGRKRRLNDDPFTYSLPSAYGSRASLGGMTNQQTESADDAADSADPESAAE